MREPRRLREQQPDSELARALHEAGTLGSERRINRAWESMQLALGRVPADRIADGGRGGGKTSGGQLRGKGWVVISALVAVGAAYWMSRPQEPSPSPIQSQSQSPIQSQSPSPIPSQSPSPSPSPIPSPIATLTPIQIQTPIQIPTPTPTQIQTQTPIPHARSTRPHSRATADRAPQVNDELALLTRAQDALARSPETALSLLAEHEQRFAHGLLVEEREVLRIDAERALGRADSAAERAQAFVTRFPRSPQRPRLQAWLSARSHDQEPSAAPNKSQPELIPSE